MKKTRYLLALCNIKPTGADKEKMAAALLLGNEKRETSDARRASSSALRAFIIALLVLCAAVGTGIGVYKAVTDAAADPVTTETEDNADFVLNEGYLLITPLYQHNSVYDLFRTVMNCSSDVYAAFSSIKPTSGDVYVMIRGNSIFDMFNSGEDDKDDVIMSLFAYAEPGKILYTDQVSEYAEDIRRLIIATETSGTFENIVSIKVLVRDSRVYTQKALTQAVSDQNGSVIFFGTGSSAALEWVECGRVQTNDGIESYMFNAGFIDFCDVTKIRIENGLPVIYSSGSCELKITSQDEFTRDGIRYCSLIGVKTGGDNRVFLPYERTPVSLGNAQFRLVDIPKQYFSPPPPDMRREVCTIINSLGCDWFGFLEASDDRYIGIPLFCDNNGYLYDYSFKYINAYFDPNNSAVPVIDLESQEPMIVAVGSDDVANGKFTVPYSVTPVSDQSTPVYTYYSKTNCFRGYDLSIMNRCFSVEQFVEADSVGELEVNEKMRDLLDMLGIGYTARFDLPYSKLRWIISAPPYIQSITSSSFEYNPFYNRYVKAPSELHFVGASRSTGDAGTESFYLTRRDAPRYFKTKQVTTFRVDTLYGYKITGSGFITDLNGRVIGLHSSDRGTELFSDPVCPLYVISDKDGLLYIGFEMPDMYEEFLPFVFIEVPGSEPEYGGQAVKFCFGYLQNFAGPYMIPADYSVYEDGNNFIISFSFEDPEYSIYSFCKYDSATHVYSKVTVGAYGDRFIQDLGNTSYRTEFKEGAVRKPYDEIKITVYRSMISSLFGQSS